MQESFIYTQDITVIEKGMIILAMSPLPPEFMPLRDFAKAMGKGIEWAANELRADSRRPPNERQYPFAITTYSEDKDAWSYRTHRKRFERWQECMPFDIDYDELADRVVDKLIVRMRQEGSQF